MARKHNSKFGRYKAPWHYEDKRGYVHFNPDHVTEIKRKLTMSFKDSKVFPKFAEVHRQATHFGPLMNASEQSVYVALSEVMNER